jgi:NTF2 fold immunity protein
MRTPMITTLLLFLVLSCGATQMQREHAPKPQQKMDEWQALEISLKNAQSIHPKDGFVPDEATAAKIGEAAAIAQYGEPRIAGERPFHARLFGDTWIVKGTLHPEGALGGTAVIKVRKVDGKILFLIHQE